MLVALPEHLEWRTDAVTCLTCHKEGRVPRTEQVRAVAAADASSEQL